jgi:hypothetical protein
MSQLLSRLYGQKLGAADGDVGRVCDFHLDEQTWSLRYLRADGGDWRPGREFLFTARAFGSRAFGRMDADSEVLRVIYNRQKISGSPRLAPPKVKLTREDDEAQQRYYGSPDPWRAGNAADVTGVSDDRSAASSLSGAVWALSLPSTKSMAGYRVSATDGPAGKVVDFLVEPFAWAVEALVVVGGPWYARRQWLLAPSDIVQINHTDGTVEAGRSGDELRRVYSAVSRPASNDAASKRLA